jgi:hypothetical protein
LNSFIISHLLELSKGSQLLSGINFAFDQCAVSFHIKRLNQKLFFSNINTDKTLTKNCRNLSTSLKCFACIHYHWKKFLVQSVFVKRCPLISLYIAHTLVLEPTTVHMGARDGNTFYHCRIFPATRKSNTPVFITEFPFVFPVLPCLALLCRNSNESSVRMLVQEGFQPMQILLMQHFVEISESWQFDREMRSRGNPKLTI